MQMWFKVRPVLKGSVIQFEIDSRLQTSGLNFSDGENLLQILPLTNVKPALASVLARQ